MKILLVCLGNICRSPLAEGILRSKSEQSGLDHVFDSSGTSNWHIGEQPDHRGISIAKKYGIDISTHRAKQFTKRDFDEFDLILAMDKSNYSHLMNMAKTSDEIKKIKLFMNFAYPNTNVDVHDPYYDGRFQDVYDILNEAGDKIIENLNLYQ